MKLSILNTTPFELLSAPPEKIHSILGGPTIIDIPSSINPNADAIFISILLHGNERSGFFAVQKILNEINNEKFILPRRFILFIGNTIATEQNLRQLPDQTDFNRVWSGGDCKLASVAKEVLLYLQKKKLFCAIDIHNNTGHNPFYSCINKVDHEYLSLAKFFFKPTVYFTRPHEVLSMALTPFCPSVTLEVGLSGDAQGIQILVEKLKSLFLLPSLENLEVPAQKDIYHTMGKLMIDPRATIDFQFSEESENDFSFVPNIDHFNFTALTVGQVLAYVKNPELIWIEDHPMENCFYEYFCYRNKKLVVQKNFIPAMLTQNQNIMKSDCFCYIMETL